MLRRFPGSLSRPLSSPLRAAPARVVPTPAVRFASSSSSSGGSRFLGTTAVIAVSALAVAYYYDTRSVAHEHIVMPVVRAMADPEQGHKIAVRVLTLPSWLRPRDMRNDAPELKAELFGMPVDNPVGVAAGFDKDAQAVDGLFDLGFGYVEIGSVCPQPQPGNPQPRFFRLDEDEAAINRYGFNSLGHGQALGQLRGRIVKFSQDHPELFPSPLPLSPAPPAGLPRSLRPGHLLGVNLGKNKTSAADSNDDYVRGVRVLGPYADVVVINVSSPNTPGLRALQGRETLERLLSDVVSERDRIAVDGLPKIAVKVTCDLGEEELADVASAVRKTGVDGVIMSNTTVRRHELGLQSEHKGEIGGLSGRPLFPYALNALRTLRPLLPPSIPIIGAGGVWTGDDAIAMARAGASTVQIYTSFGYKGVGAPALLKDQVVASLPAGSTWKDQVGAEYAHAPGQAPVALSWDENRVKAESEAIKAEVQTLAQLMSDLKATENAAEAAVASSKVGAAIADAPEVAAPAPTPNLTITAGPEDAVPAAAAAIEGLLEAAPAYPVAPAGEPDVVQVNEVMFIEPVVIEIEVEAPRAVNPPKDEFTAAVRDGGKRLV